MTGRCLASGGEAERRQDTVNEGRGREGVGRGACFFFGGGKGLEFEVEGLSAIFDRMLHLIVQFRTQISK